MADPNIRMQNIAIEHAELLAARSMSWGEAANRTTAFMTVVGSAAVALALISQASDRSVDLALLGLLVLPVVLVIGLTSLGRVWELDSQDMRWVRGLNRLRHLRLELDPQLEAYLVNSRHDDFESVLTAYREEGRGSFVTAFFTLVAFLALVNSVIAGCICGLAAIELGANGAIAVVAGVVGTVLFGAMLLAVLFRQVTAEAGMARAIVPRVEPPGAADTVETIEEATSEAPL